MRILGGTARGRRLAGPPGPSIRPTAGRVKEALFNILAARVPGARFLDLFAGTGLVGIEALSRGARYVTFVESNAVSCRLLRENLRRCQYGPQADIRPVSAVRFLKDLPDEPYDLVFLDPPYRTGAAEKILPSLGRDAIIRPNGLVVIEHFHKTPFLDRLGHLSLVRSYRYGDTSLSVYRPVHTPEPA